MNIYECGYELLAKKWELEEVVSHWMTPTSAIYQAVRASDKLPVILKFTKCRRKALFEARALQFYDGQSSPKLFCFDEEAGAILEEQIVPGRDLMDIFRSYEEPACECCVEIIKLLHEKPLTEPEKFQSLESYLDPLFSLKVLEDTNIGYVREMARLLLSSTKTAVLLHADLHATNIIVRNDKEMLAIDPRGVVGDFAYEPAPFICLYRLPNASDVSQWASLLRQRVELFSNLLGIEAFRIKGWASVFAARKACLAAKLGAKDAKLWLDLAFTLGTI